MKKATLTALACCSLALPLWAMGDGVEEIDTNGDGVLTIEEVQIKYPDVTADSFSEADANSDGVLDMAELTAAQEAGLMPADSEG